MSAASAAARSRDNRDRGYRPAARPSPLAVFIARAEARAILFAAGDIDLHEAVDALQASAVASGLVSKLGQDRVQEIMAAAFAAVRKPDVVEIAEAELPMLATLPQVTSAACEIQLRASASTVEAVMYALREYGTDALHRGNTRARLAELSNRQIEAVIARLARMRSKYSTISERLLLALAELLP